MFSTPLGITHEEKLGSSGFTVFDTGRGILLIDESATASTLDSFLASFLPSLDLTLAACTTGFGIPLFSAF